MAGSTDVAKRDAPAVPALVPTPALDPNLGADDIAIPRLYIGNFMSEAVKSRLVEFGDVYLALGKDDKDPQVLWTPGSKDNGVLFHVLDLRLGKSWQDGGRLETTTYDDPAAPDDAWTTYNYTLFLPDVDPDMPAKLLLTKSGKSQARKINTILMRNAAAGPPWNHAFRLTSERKENDKGEFAVAQVASAQPDPAHVRQAGELYELVAPSIATGSSTSITGDEPAI